MQMAIHNGELLLRYLDSMQYQIIKDWNLMRWDKQNQMLRGPVTADLLNSLAGITLLSQPVEDERNRLNAMRQVIETERGSENPKPLCSFPVKAKLYKHQIRAVNMSLLTFGLIPEGNK